MLAVSLLLEGYSLLVAVRTVTAGAAAAGLPFAEFVRRGMDPTSIAVMMEDGAACAGLVIAGMPCAAQCYHAAFECHVTHMLIHLHLYDASYMTHHHGQCILVCMNCHAESCEILP